MTRTVSLFRSALAAVLKISRREELSDLRSKERYMDLLIRMLLLKLGDGCRCGSSAETVNPHRAALTVLRAEIYNSVVITRTIRTDYFKIAIVAIVHSNCVQLHHSIFISLK